MKVPTRLSKVVSARAEPLHATRQMAHPRFEFLDVRLVSVPNPMFEIKDKYSGLMDSAYLTVCPLHFANYQRRLKPLLQDSAEKR